MTKEQKTEQIQELSAKLSDCSYFYICNANGMTVEQINKFRRMCFDRGIEYKVYKNTIIKKAIETLAGDFEVFNQEVLKGTSGILFSPANGKLPAQLLKEFYKLENSQLPVLKGASIEYSPFIGAEQLDALLTIKSKQELIGEIVGLLQSPAKNVVSALQSGGGKLAGILKTLSEK